MTRSIKTPAFKTHPLYPVPRANSAGNDNAVRSLWGRSLRTPPGLKKFVLTFLLFRNYSFAINNVAFPLQAITSSDQSTSGSEIVLLTDGEDNRISSCFQEVKHSGAIIHTIALGPSAARELETLSDMTGTTWNRDWIENVLVVFLSYMIFLHKQKTAQKFPV